MKYIFISILICFIFLPKTNAQTGVETDCGVTYSYDAVGNRIQRAPIVCGFDTRMLVVTDSTKNTTNQQLTEALYPNPTGGPVSVVFNTPVMEAKVTIIDYLGRQLYSATVSGTNIPLDLSHYNDGVYMIVVRTGGNSYESTVVKE
jgi:hypothetical protein